MNTGTADGGPSQDEHPTGYGLTALTIAECRPPILLPPIAIGP